MPTRVKSRSPNGTVSRGKKGPCGCDPCTCGPPARPAAFKPKPTDVNVAKFPLEGHSETYDAYKAHQISRTKPFKPAQQAVDKRSLEGESESHAQYGAKAIPPRPQKHITELTVSPSSPLDGGSETHEKYRAHEVHKIVQYKPEYKPTPNRDIDSVTESRVQYTAKEVPPRPKAHVARYEKNEAKLEGGSETHEVFQALPIEQNPISYKPKTALPPKRNLEGVSESASQYKEKDVPPRPTPHIRKYEPNTAKFEGESELKSAYKEWPNQGIPKKFGKSVATPTRSANKLEGISVTHSDYHAFDHPDHVGPIKRVSEYHAPTGQLDKYSLYHDEFRPHTDVKPPLKHEREATKFGAEDRSFVSVSSSAYKEYGVENVHVPVKHKQPYVPNNNKLEGESVLHSDFKAYDVANVERRDLKQAARADRQGHIGLSKDSTFAKDTEYNSGYKEKSMSGRSQAIKPVLESTVPGSGVPLEGQSELHRSFKSPSEVSGMGSRVYAPQPNFKPSNERKHVQDKRDFISETQDVYDVAKLGYCQCSDE